MNQSFTAPHRTERASFLTNISQGSVATRLRCGGLQIFWGL